MFIAQGNLIVQSNRFAQLPSGPDEKDSNPVSRTSQTRAMCLDDHLHRRIRVTGGVCVCLLSGFPSARAQETVLFTVQANILHDGNETAMILLGLTNTRAEDSQKVGTGDTSGWNRSVDFGRGREGLV